jgi:hypothetical protein
MIALLLAALALTVRPQMAMAPAAINACVRLTAPETARMLRFTLTSLDYARTSERPIVPTGSPQTICLSLPWAHVPPGVYVVSVALLDQAGTRLGYTSSSAEVH